MSFPASSLVIAALALVFLGSPAHATDSEPAEAVIDHVGLGVADLDAAVAWFAEATGVEPVAGGSHPGRGTRNALVSLGGARYLELLAPDPAQAGVPGMADGLRALERPTPVLWALASDDVGALAERLRAEGLGTTEVMPGSRDKPDGGRLAWRTVGVTEPAHPLMPFFIEWREGSAHPAATSPSGCTLESVSLAHPEPDETRALMARLGVAVEVHAAEAPRLSFSIACPAGELAF